MANTSATWQQAAHTTYQLSSPSCSTRAIQKNLTLNEKYLSFLEKSQENGPLAEKWQDRKSKRTRQKRKKTREEIGNGNQMTALREREREKKKWMYNSWGIWITLSFVQFPLLYMHKHWWITHTQINTNQYDHRSFMFHCEELHAWAVTEWHKYIYIIIVSSV